MNSSRRATIALALTLGPGASLWSQQPTAKPKVVFVCEHGAAKSIMAAAEFERIAKARELEFSIVSRGTNPDAEIAAVVRTGLKADGMDVGSAKPIKVIAKDLAGAVRIVSFGPDLSALLPKGMTVLDWSPMPPPNKDYEASRDHLRRKLEVLMDELQTKNNRK